MKHVAEPATSPDLRRLLLAYTISTIGTLLGSGVVMWIAITEVGVSGAELGLLSGLATLAAGPPPWWSRRGSTHGINGR